jgi:hypothetical protein
MKSKIKIIINLFKIKMKLKQKEVLVQTDILIIKK